MVLSSCMVFVGFLAVQLKLDAHHSAFRVGHSAHEKCHQCIQGIEDMVPSILLSGTIKTHLQPAVTNEKCFVVRRMVGLHDTFLPKC